MEHKIIAGHLFKDLALPRKDLPVVAQSRYLVYKDAKEFIIVDAANAKEALAASGLTDVYRIKRENRLLNNILSFALTGRDSATPKEAPKVEASEPVAPPETAPPAEPATAAEPPPPVAEPPKPEDSAALSNEEVSNLLKG